MRTPAPTTPFLTTATDNVGRPPIVVVMGPAGCGKTTVGQALALRLGVPFVDGDSFHTAAAIESMRLGVALSDEDREPWLDALAQRLHLAEQAVPESAVPESAVPESAVPESAVPESADAEPADLESADAEPAGLVLACSALKAKYRTRLRAGEPFQRRLAYLAVPAAVLRRRLAARAGHFAGPTLLDSQLAALEVPVAAETYDGTSPPEVLVAEMLHRMGLRPKR